MIILATGAPVEEQVREQHEIRDAEAPAYCD
jgi:hypothetical protein